MIRVRVTQLDGPLPNLALMTLAAWHSARGDEIHVRRSIARELDEPAYDRVYGSAIFTTTAKKVAAFRRQFPEAIVGGTGSDSRVTVETIAGPVLLPPDYSVAPASFTASIGFTQRGCRLKCRFCVVPAKEGRPWSVADIGRIWRGPGHPRDLHLLDNDFFGQDEGDWRARLDEIRAGGFRVCFSQGINVRAITPDTAAALASIEYRNAAFDRRRLYTAWDNLGDERVFFAGVDRLEAAGVPARHLMAYMLVGFDRRETFARIRYRFDRMVERGIKPFVMVYDPADHALKRFQRWANLGLYRFVPFGDYDAGRKSRRMPCGELLPGLVLPEASA